MNTHRIRKMRAIRTDGNRTRRARMKTITRRYQRRLLAEARA